MSPQRLIVVVAAAAVVVTGAVWWMLPALQPAPQRVEIQAIVHVERARRILDLFNADLAYRALLVDQLRDEDVDVDAGDPAALAEEMGDDYQTRHEAFWKAFEPKDWNDGVGRPARANYGNLPGQIRDGVGTRKKIVEDNAALLNDALAEADAALAVTVGDNSGRSYAEANRIKATVLYHRGLAERVKASLHRAAAEPLLRELVGYGEQAGIVLASQNLIADSGIDGRIKDVRDRLTESESRVAELGNEESKVNATIRDLESKWSAAKTRAAAARAEMDRLRAAGVDFSNPQGGEAFQKQLMEQDAAFRSAERQVQELEAGSLPNAKIDASGNFLRGRYVEGGRTDKLTVSNGLNHFRTERSVLTVKTRDEQAGVEALKLDLARLEALRESYQQDQTQAEAQLKERKADAADAFDELSKVQSEAEAVEESALKFFDQSAAAAQQAATLADQWVSESRERTLGLSPEAKERSAFNSRTDDAWLGGFTGAQVADARQAKAWVYYDRFDAASRTGDALASLTRSIPLSEADPAAFRAKADEARAAGIKEIESAMVILEKSHRNTDRHWTLTAQGAEITYLMVLFGQGDYLADAVDAYRNAIKGRENEPYVAKIASRLKHLENR